MPKKLEIVSGDKSRPFWKEINDIKSTSTIDDIHDVLYSIGCKLQELESEIEKLKPTDEQENDMGYNKLIYDDLKPCPFCGNVKPKTWWDWNPEGYKQYREGFNIECCIAHACSTFKGDSIGIWNKRATKG